MQATRGVEPPTVKGFDCMENVGPIAAKLKAKGIAFVGRYYSLNAHKNLLGREAQQLAAQKINCVTVFEGGAENALGGEAAGKHDAAVALRCAVAAGQPPGTPIYFAVDFDASSGQLNGAVIAYAHAFSQALLGTHTVGVYGSGLVCQTLLNLGLARYAWLGGAMGWQGSRVFTGWHIKQGLPGDPYKLGFQVDPDSAKPGDYGGWLALVGDAKKP